jgi:hypothetical protein
MKTTIATFLVILYIAGTGDAPAKLPRKTSHGKPRNAYKDSISLSKTIHVLVALCDNKYQGIVPVRAKAGNGQDPESNLYWGWGYGVKAFFKKSTEWKFIRSEKKNHPVFERLLFKSTHSDYFLVADAYDGRNMKDCITDYLKSVAGITNDTVLYENKSIGIYGNAKMMGFIGHNGLMDFNITTPFPHADKRIRDCIILACYSKNYFAPLLKQAGANPVLWTTNLMGPEAYTLHDALSGYTRGESPGSIQKRAAEAYSGYTKCGVKAAGKLLVTGW